MDRHRIPAFSILLAATLVAALPASKAGAQRSPRLVYNPVTGKTEPERRRQTQPLRRAIPRSIQDASREHTEEAKYIGNVDGEVEGENVDHAGYFEPCACGNDYCRGDSVGCSSRVGCSSAVGCDDIGCGDSVCGSLGGRNVCRPRAGFYAGFEATFVKPRFENNTAFTVMESDGASFESFSDTEFDYDLEFTPRVFLGWQHGDGVGMRVTWWQFDHEAATASANPAANGFGAITHPTFGTVDISSAIPTDTFSAATDLNAYTIDLEATKQTSFSSWDLGLGCGIRHAYTEQSYRAQLRNTNDVLRGQINYRNSLRGLGPTISLDAYRPFGCQSGIFCKARGSVLFGDGKSNLAALEDADLTTSFNTTRTTGRDDLLSIGEVQVGYRWKARQRQGTSFRPFFSVAMEGQIWNGAGNATSEEGTLGFFGFNTGMGVDW